VLGAFYSFFFMENETYLINYGVYFKNGHYESHTMKVKNCMSELHAKIKLEDYLKKKHSDFNNLVVHKCRKDFLGMSDIFGKSNPFF